MQNYLVELNVAGLGIENREQIRLEMINQRVLMSSTHFNYPVVCGYVKFHPSPSRALRNKLIPTSTPLFGVHPQCLVNETIPQ